MEVTKYKIIAKISTAKDNNNSNKKKKKKKKKEIVLYTKASRTIVHFRVLYDRWNEEVKTHFLQP